MNEIAERLWAIKVFDPESQTTTTLHKYGLTAEDAEDAVDPTLWIVVTGKTYEVENA